jgi:hypothetical protein
MTHLLIIKDKTGRELARVPVTEGYTAKEVPLPKEVAETKKDPDKGIPVGDSGSGKERAG